MGPARDRMGPARDRTGPHGTHLDDLSKKKAKKFQKIFNKFSIFVLYFPVSSVCLNHILSEITPEVYIQTPVCYIEINLGLKSTVGKLKSTVGKFVCFTKYEINQ